MEIPFNFFFYKGGRGNGRELNEGNSRETGSTWHVTVQPSDQRKRDSLLAGYRNLCFSALNLPCYLDQMVVASLFQGFSWKKERKSYRRGSSGSYNKRRLPAVSRHLEISHRLMFTLRAGFRVLVSPCGTAVYYTIGCRLGKKLESAKWKGVGGLGRSLDTSLPYFNTPPFFAPSTIALLFTTWTPGTA